MSRQESAPGKILDLEDGLSDCGAVLVEVITDIAADHHGDEFAHIGLGNPAGCDVAPVAQNGDAIANAEDAQTIVPPI
jgi:hypothetical protein